MFRRARATIPAMLVIVVMGFGGLLRLDAFVQTYGTLDRPFWARILTHHVAPLAAFVRPDRYRWHRVEQPYVGGDPINYLKYAREMHSFYQAHVREPIFLALTRGFLWLLSDQDAAVSFASMTGSVLAVLATYLLGAVLLSRPAGFFAALIVAIDFQLISWSVEGWRDDVFMAMVVLSAWAFVRCGKDPSIARASTLGVAAAGACMTRITALSFVVPALGWLVFDGAVSSRHRRMKAVAAAAIVLALLAGPYFISCAIATGDPFYAIDYHTVFYRHGEGLPSQAPMSAGAYVWSKIAGHPIGTMDTVVTGLFVQPFENKWNGLGAWVPGMGSVLAWLAIAGLVAWCFSPEGRLLLIVLFGSLLPYAWTWNIRGGGEFRFTIHAYSFYVVAALSALSSIAAGASGLRRTPGHVTSIAWRPVALRAAALVTVGAIVCATYNIVLPWFVAREKIVSGDDVSIETGSRDWPFFGAGWSAPYIDGPTFRLSGERAIVRIPLPERRDYQVVLRLDPAATDRQHRAVVLLNRQMLAILHLVWDPNRVGAYPLLLPSDKVRVGSNELTIVTDTVVPAESAGIHVPSQVAGNPLGVRLWYVRVLGPGPAASLGRRQ